MKMKSEHELLDVLFPCVRAQLLRILFSRPQKPRYVRELRNLTGLALSTVQDELRKLVAVRLIRHWSNRYHRFYQANDKHPTFPHILSIVQMSRSLPKTKRSILHPHKSRGATQRKPGRREPRFARNLPRS